MSKNIVAFLVGQLFFNQLEHFESFLNCSDWLDKSLPPKKSTFFYRHVNKLFRLLSSITIEKSWLGRKKIKLLLLSLGYMDIAKAVHESYTMKFLRLCMKVFNI